MGDVYLAEDSRLGRKVALKVLPSSYQYDTDRRDRFLREARAASALRSSNVTAIYDIGEHENTMFIAMEYVEGELLSDKLAHGPLSVPQAVDIAIQVAEALEEAHSLSIVHRDIKSANVIVAARGVVKVLDFGLAKMLVSRPQDPDQTAPLGKETSPGVILGTVSYMSPEQALGQDIDERSDLFSLGVLLYEMLTGKQPFAGNTTAELLVAILNHEPPPLTDFSTEMSSEVQWIISKALRKDRELRYQTARDFIVDLRNLGHGLKTVVLEPAETGYRTRGIKRRTGERAAKRDSASRGKRRKTLDSIAVMPFENSTHDSEIDYLVDGITEGVINTLSRMPKLRVMARSTVFRYKGRDVDPQQVAAELNVRAVLTGRIRKMGDQFVIGAELVDVADGAQVWGNQYTRTMSTLVTLQDDISTEIGEKLKVKLTSGERKKLANLHPKNSGAYDLYLRGLYHWSKWTPNGFQQAIASFEEALGKDPGFALAYSGLADCFGVSSYLAMDPAEAQGLILKSKAYAKRALELDEALPEAHLTLGNIAHFHDWDWARAERELKLVLELNPNLAQGHQSYSLFLMDQCLFDDAISEAELALQLDPLSLPISTSSGYVHFCAGHYDEAIQRLKSTAESGTELQLAHQMFGASLERIGKNEQAVAEYVKMMPDGPRGSELAESLREAFASSGMVGFWRRYAEIAPELVGQRLITPIFVTVIHASLGDNDAAFEWLERAFAVRLPLLSHIQADPRFAPLRSDARFGELLRRMGVPPVVRQRSV
jgi:serine/threonine protein kinase/tetratricopeptide (TPR) repeat protein